MSAEDIQRIIELTNPESIHASYTLDLPRKVVKKLGIIDYGNIHGNSEDPCHREFVMRNTEPPEITDSLYVPNRLSSVILHISNAKNGNGDKRGLVVIDEYKRTVEDYSHVLTVEQESTIQQLGYMVLDGTKLSNKINGKKS
jgi:hypothetical protein